MSENALDPRSQRGRRTPWLIIVPLIFACGVIACGVSGATTTVIGQEESILSDDIAPVIGVPTVLLSAIIGGIALGVAAVGLWLRLTKRSYRIVTSVVEGMLGILGLPIFFGIIFLSAELPVDINEMPWSILIGAPFFALAILALSITVGLLAGPALIIASLVAKTTTAPPPPEQPPSSKRVCPACGAENPPDYSFCERCGSEL
jgi:hypothetical protein